MECLFYNIWKGDWNMRETGVRVFNHKSILVIWMEGDEDKKYCDLKCNTSKWWSDGY